MKPSIWQWLSLLKPLTRKFVLGKGQKVFSFALNFIMFNNHHHPHPSNTTIKHHLGKWSASTYLSWRSWTMRTKILVSWYGSTDITRSSTLYIWILQRQICMNSIIGRWTANRVFSIFNLTNLRPIYHKQTSICNNSFTYPKLAECLA